jgi:addiction module HigA family antidote
MAKATKQLVVCLDSSGYEVSLERRKIYVALPDAPAEELPPSLAKTSWTSTTRTITDTAMQMHNPPHPGEILRELCLGPLELSVTDAAKALGVSRKTLSAVLNGRAGISPEMAVRLSIAFDTSAESWLNQQVQYDLWVAEKRRKSLKVVRLAA